jgi:hypothetical protein
MRFHTRQFEEPQQRIEQARALLKLIIEANPPQSLYRSLAEMELKRLLRTPDAALFHDSLSEYNEPISFHDFITAAGEHGLQYLAEADVADMNDAKLPEAVRQKLAALRKLIEKEQYLDILTNREFRQTLLCRAGCRINRVLDGSTCDALWFSSAAEESPGDQQGQVVFRARRGIVATTIPLVHAVLRAFKRGIGHRLTYSEITSEVQRVDMHLAADIRSEARSVLLRCVMSGVVEMHARAAPFVTQVTLRPVASPLARLQVRDAGRVSTLGHRSVEIIDPLTRRLLPLVDGRRTVSELAIELEADETLVNERLRLLAEEELLLRT